MSIDNHTRQPLDRSLRKALETTVGKAREVAEQAATQALTRLSVGDAKTRRLPERCPTQPA